MWLFGLADRHMEALYLGAGLVYLVSFILLCTNVREGEYPPPAPVARREKWWAWIKDYFETTTSAPLWRWLILMVMMFNVAMVSNTYWTFFGRDDLGCSLDFIGQIAAYGSICSIPVILLVGWAVDRFSPVSMVMGALMFSALVSTGGFFQINSPASLMIYGVLSVCGLVWMQAALMPMYNELFPHARFGQFCSVTAVFSMSAVMLGNYGLGRLLDHLGDYRWLMVWRAAFWGIGAVAMLMVFIHYRKLGGRQHYRPPAD
ncbi:MAG: MFS transporter [Chthoniobacterales bacterium]